MSELLTVIVPAYNECASIADTIRSLQAQTTPPAEIVVVDDASTDGTGEIARACGATVLRPPRNTGSKAGAQTFALGRVRTPLVMALDADTILAPDALERITPVMGTGVAAACGFVVPRHVRTVWERGRYIEYLLAFTYYKPIQNYFERPLISSGCFSMYRTELLKAVGGWPDRTLAEDMDLTWTFYERGQKVRFVPGAVCYPIEPESFDLLGKQLRRWSHGFVQNVKLHGRRVLDVPGLRWFVGVALVDATLSSFYYLILLPLLIALFAAPLLLLLYLIDLPMIVIPVLVQARRRKEIGRALASLPAYVLMRFVNSYYFLEAIVTEVLLRRTYRVYEKGH